MSGNWSKSAFFEGGWVNLNADFRGKGASFTNHSWHQSSRVIALSCGIKISAVRHLVLSQSTRVTDRRTDRITTPNTALAYARAVITDFSCFGFVAWHRERTSVFGRRTFAVLRSTYSRWVTTYFGKPSSIGQPIRPTKPFILSRLILN